MTGVGANGPDRARPSRERELEAEVARLRAALARAGVDAGRAAERAAGETVAAREETRQARADATRAAADHAREMVEGRAEPAGSETLNAELRRANEALAASEERCRAVVESAADCAIVTTDQRGRITGWNRGARNVLGWAESEVLLRDAALIFTPEDREAGVPEAEMRRALRDGRAEDERWHVRRDGTRFWASGQLTPLRDGGRRGFLKVLHDRTAQRTAERERERLLAMLSQSQTMVCGWDGRVEVWSQGMERLFGFTPPEAVGALARELLGSEFPEPWAEVVAALRREGRWVGEVRHRAKDGSPRVVQATWLVQPGQDGAASSLVAAEEDHTAARRAEERLRASEARLAADLAGMRRLHDLHARLAGESDLKAALGEILAAACEFTGTDRGCVQLVSDDGERLEMFATHGYGPGSVFVEHFMHEGSKPACDAARRDRARLVIEDVATFPPLAGTRDREVALAEGIRATQSTPMVSRDGALRGVLSNQFRAAPHRPAEERLKLIDLLAWTAADFVARHRAEAALRESEARQAFLLGLGDALRPLSDPEEVKLTAAQVLGRHLGASRVAYAENEEGRESFVVSRNYTDGVPEVVGRYRYEDYGSDIMSGLQAGQTRVQPGVSSDARLGDAERQALADAGVAASLNVPLVKSGRLVAFLGINYRAAHDFQPREIELVTEVAERTWAAVERARAEAALRESQQRLQRVLETDAVAVLFFGQDGVLADANDVFLRRRSHTGCSPSRASRRSPRRR